MKGNYFDLKEHTQGERYLGRGAMEMRIPGKKRSVRATGEDLKDVGLD